jgi:EpsI family protein
MFSLGVIFLEIFVLKLIPPRGTRDSSKANKGEEISILPKTSELIASPQSPSRSNPKTPSSRVNTSLSALLTPPHFIAAVLLLTVTLFLSTSIDFREKIPIKRSLHDFPLQVGEWTGNRVTIEPKFLDPLNLSDYVMIDYKNRLGKEVNFYVAYYESQRKGQSVHSPGSCLPGSGWIFSQADTTTVPIPGHMEGSVRVNRAFMRKNGKERLSYYWFPQRGRILTNLYQLKLFAFWDALTKQRTDGALVRIITAVYPSENLEDADRRLQAYAREIVPLLEPFIPD